MDFPHLEAELDAWAQSGRQAPIWWRDDDAVAPSAALDRLFGLAAGAGAPLALAVIPAQAGPALEEALAAAARVRVLVHGLSHTNHEPPERKKCEFGPARPLSVLEADASAALQTLRALIPKTLPVFVPPWNRIRAELKPRLSALGFRGLSTAGACRVPAQAGLRIANTHLDPIAWKDGRGLADATMLDARAAAHLRALREGALEPEPLGLLTHHLVQSEAVWAFVGAFAGLIAAHPGAQWADPEALFCPVAIGPRNG